MAKSLRILFVASEATPLAKTGGMADVCDALPKYLAAAGHQVDVALPLYHNVRATGVALEPLVQDLEVDIAGQIVTGAVHTAKIDRPWRPLLIENDFYFDRRGLYTDPDTGQDYPDNAARFAFFAKGVLAMIQRLKLKYDVVHTHDWQGALPIVLLRKQDGQEKLWRNPATVLTIHNLGYQGIFPADAGATFGLPPESFSVGELEFYGQWNLLKGGLVHADFISTVSEKYAKEILTPEFSFGLGDVLNNRANSLVGITHGVDYAEWNPATDPHIAATYNAKNKAGKVKCKLDLLNAFGLSTELKRRPVAGFVGRLVEQKGLDLIAEVVEDLIAHGYLLVFLGSGQAKYENTLRDLAARFPGQAAAHIGFSDELAHKITAGADVLLLPSLYEPCGLSQMYAQKYGTLPVVRATGGLDDTVKGWTKGGRGANGFSFTDKTPEAFLRVMADAAMLYDDKVRWEKLVAAAMATDYGWETVVPKYERMYAKAIRAKTARVKATE